MTYARARLWLGISGVGTMVVVTGVVAYALSGPAESSAGIGGELSRLALFFGGWAAVLVPFDVLGGYVLPRAFGRRHPTLGAFAAGLVRGVATQWAVLFAIAAATLLVGRAFGDGAAFGVVSMAVVLLGAFQARLARAVGGLSPLVEKESPDAPPVFTQGADDEGFTGGVVGFFRPRVVVPARWSDVLAVDEYAATLVRRRAVIETGGRGVGFLIAAAWVLVGVGLALLLPGAGAGTAREVVLLYCGATWWTFLGLLLLPTLSRGAVLAIDARARRAGVDAAVLRSAAEKLDALQDGEPTRGKFVESIFHPLPSVENRERAEHAGGPVAWHAARTMVFLSWAAGGLLSRSVHCNAGRPQLWVFLPCE